MVQNMMSNEEEKRLRSVFINLDIDGDGLLDRNEIEQGLTKLNYSKSHIKKECNRIFESVDVDKSGRIEFSEFLQASVDKESLLTEEKLKTTFKWFDRDNSGSISVPEF